MTDTEPTVSAPCETQPREVVHHNDTSRPNRVSLPPLSSGDEYDDMPECGWTFGDYMLAQERKKRAEKEVARQKTQQSRKKLQAYLRGLTRDEWGNYAFAVCTTLDQIIALITSHRVRSRMAIAKLFRKPPSYGTAFVEFLEREGILTSEQLATCLRTYPTRQRGAQPKNTERTTSERLSSPAQ
ncbi:MAG: hypothetical protein OEY86_04330 [Nitrospira sp.]|nr:hypothetical protein [Nitrospira sp.]